MDQQKEAQKEAPAEPVPVGDDGAPVEKSELRERMLGRTKGRKISLSQRFARIDLKMPAVNPFVNSTLTISPYEWLKLILCSVTIAPIRLVVILLLMLMAWGIVTVAISGYKPEDLQKTPLKGWRKGLLYIVRFLGRVIMFVWGFYWINVTGQPADFDEAPIVVSNHIGWFDIFFFYYHELPRFISRKENMKIPIIGSILCAMQNILVDRTDANSKRVCMDAIKEHANRPAEEGWPRLLIFPEGTCNNQRGLISFKAGAFIPGAPVQPVAIKYPFINFDCCWVNGINFPLLVWRSLCQFQHYMEVKYLPVHKPNRYEKENPILFATNVRAAIARALNIPTTEHSFEDVAFAMQAMKLQMRPESFAEVDLLHLREYAKMTEKDLQNMLQKFSKFDADQSGDIAYAEFREALGLPDSEEVERLFHLMDTDESGTLSWKEYISGIALLSTEVNDEDAIKLAFQLFDENGDQKVEEAELFAIMRRVFPTISREEVSQLFNKVDVRGSGYIDYDQFLTFVRANPEYLQLIKFKSANLMEKKDV